MADEKRILYVEDEADIREVAEFALEGEGFELLLCASGEEALQKVLNFSPDMILLDVMMPGMDGPTTLKRLRELPAMEKVPIVFLTAKIQPNEISQFLGLGAVDVISKPFDAMKLADLIREILGRCNG